MFRLQSFLLLTFLILPQPASAGDLIVDGVPLPPDARVAAPTPGGPFEPWKRAWVGAWGGSLKHILLVESVSEDGAARVVYAVGDNPSFRITPQWSRLEGTVSERMLKVSGPGFSATYEMAGNGRLKARYERGANVARAEMTGIDFASLARHDVSVAWTRGKQEFLQTDLVENGRPVRLEVVTFRPPGEGPFPLAVINHGSTGSGTDPEVFTKTWFSADLADFLNDRGWIVAFPQRRGRGKSDGLYDEGFGGDRRFGYACNAEMSLRGADRALDDVDAAISELRGRQDVARSPVLIGGISRGGALSVAYAGLHPEQIAGVINFVGGWLGERCDVARVVNHSLFERGAAYARPTIWLYGQNDPYYSIAHSRDNFAAFEKAGGHGEFLEFEAPPGQGHFILGRPTLWSGPLDRYLKSLVAPGTR